MTPPWVLDLDGVVWRGDEPIQGSVAAIRRLREAGHPVGFCTNNSFAAIASVEAKLASMDIPAQGCVVSSAQALRSLLIADERVLVCGGPGVQEAVEAAGAVVLTRADGASRVDAVAVGYHADFDYDEMSVAARAVRGGARLLATNDDAVYPGADGPLPGCGSILAAITTAAGSPAIIAGKPYRPMADLVRERWGEAGVFVGDTLSTDGELAARLGWQFGLVLSGNTSAGDVPAATDRRWVAGDLAALVECNLGGVEPPRGRAAASPDGAGASAVGDR